MSNLIHPTAIIDPKAELDSSVKVGPYTVIGANVQIGAGTEIGAHTVIEGHTTIGENNKIFQFASLGAQPQDKKYRDEPTKLIIGNGNTIREFTTFNTGTVTGIGETRVGDDNWIMAYCHLAHDCVIGNHTIFANNSSLAGHVEIGDYVVLGGYTLVFQFCRIGAYAMTAFAAGVHKDVPPYFMASGYRAEPAGLNSEGMRRNGFSAEQIANVKKAYKAIYMQDLPLEEAKAKIAEMAKENSELLILSDFLHTSQRSIIR
ncbi:acyl-ACP--UDP-N-acetylglucosamine O-acyltransferase [Kingella negevensis]|uniref:Acyl-[acyl-carrier-protein]--UDP-N-acetylglucosamine O-acyltransferase n=1 Tax=Kingella negevensis TaxID=1522312 RepID=A0A238HIS3_9NEIS|nr:acyl-ACP--UDP-N-acetylglucosamine O-acyltransferase [Kingella negevensis]MDK4679380.1 acyl-ACP--UDP-N-acetylglucosamine O-acyltransferase [Kingella negevensis]MDK4682900.1 acyl-ACP--UDP-N-acetylglucosamine O-acyltransferase [Kingella negevensis]MDK4685481.1 acyl-ACP--UDP-N-acetylglucosamine O-acyltransferase [Kingella negevensis]MDK4691099.1 acyl-ACP--UDP-N-acetylglucosamine O-acyltransferase [Kingella negevensis]MDK4693754.1 acyl-ACP--UDP-N-acetylglucosamine O-acyltransferase [Kingella neg